MSKLEGRIFISFKLVIKLILDMHSLIGIVFLALEVYLENSLVIRG
jgi:hypothetical protein